MSYETPFAGIKVVDLSQGIAAPYAGMLLGQYGADVIKVEIPDGGDWVRATAQIPGGNTALSVIGNLGKRSIALDLKEEEGRAVLWRLIEGADVFMEGFRPGVIGRLGFDYDSVSARNPRILYLSMSGFGQDGPHAERPAMDPVLQAFVGFMAENRDSGGQPMNIASIPVDMLTALFAYQAISSALYARRDEPGGRYIEASLMQGAAWLNAYASLQRVIYDGDPPAARAHRGVYRTADGWILAIVAGRRGWGEFCAALEAPTLGQDPRFQTVQSRLEHAKDLFPIVSEIIAAKPGAHWTQRFTEHGVMHSIINNSLDVLRDPHVEAASLFAFLPQPGIGPKLPIPQIPGTTALEEGTQRATAPALGAHTLEILAEHGYDANAIAELVHKRVVAGPA
ncbi:MAG: CoA transferase [Acetobacteraceae bacterium]|nr:CoA transferase [Acetobacteraceae bacterium]